MRDKFQLSRDSQALFITAVAKDRLPVFRSDTIKLVTCHVQVASFRKVKDLPHIRRHSRHGLAAILARDVIIQTVRQTEGDFSHYLSRRPLAEPSISLASRFCRVS